MYVTLHHSQYLMLMLIILRAAVKGTRGMGTNYLRFPPCQDDLLTLCLGQCCLMTRLSVYFGFLIIKIIPPSIRNGFTKVNWTGSDTYEQSVFIRLIYHKLWECSMADIGLGFLLELLVGPSEYH